MLDSHWLNKIHNIYLQLQTVSLHRTFEKIAMAAYHASWQEMTRFQEMKCSTQLLLIFSEKAATFATIKHGMNINHQ